MIGRLRYGVFFGVRANALAQIGAGRRRTGTARTTAFVAVLHAAGSAVVPCRNDSALLDDHRGHVPSETIAPRGDHPRDIHEVGIPIRSELACGFHAGKNALRRHRRQTFKKRRE